MKPDWGIHSKLFFEGVFIVCLSSVSSYFFDGACVYGDGMKISVVVVCTTLAVSKVSFLSVPVTAVRVAMKLEQRLKKSWLMVESAPENRSFRVKCIGI